MTFSARSATLGLLTTGLLLALGAACAAPGGDDDPGGEPATGSTGPTGASVGPLPTLRPPSGPPSRPTDVFTKVRVSGVVVTGDEGCVDLEDDNGVRWTLLGPEAAALQVGDRVIVTGTGRPEQPGCSGPRWWWPPSGPPSVPGRQADGQGGTGSSALPVPACRGWCDGVVPSADGGGRQ